MSTGICGTKLFSVMDAPPTISLCLPRPPSTNRLHYQPPGFKHRIRTPEYSKWLVEAGWEARRQLVGIPRIPGAFNARVTVPKASTRDLNNHDKALLDLLTYINFINDDSGLRPPFTIDWADRSDWLLELWDLGGPPVRRRTVRKASGYSGKTTAGAKLAAAHRYWNKLR